MKYQAFDNLNLTLILLSLLVQNFVKEILQDEDESYFAKTS
jgi:hypothetical protein